MPSGRPSILSAYIFCPKKAKCKIFGRNFSPKLPKFLLYRPKHKIEQIYCSSIGVSAKELHRSTPTCACYVGPSCDDGLIYSTPASVVLVTGARIVTLSLVSKINESECLQCAFHFLFVLIAIVDSACTVHCLPWKELWPQLHGRELQKNVPRNLCRKNFRFNTGGND